MARIVIVGHGGFSPGGKMVLVPNSTSVTFYSDAGTNLGLPYKPTGPYNGGWVEGVNCDFDYDKVKAAIDGGFTSGNRLMNGGITENFSLGVLGGGSADSARKVDWWGQQAVVPASDMQLCTDPDGCPGPMLREEMRKFTESSGTEGRLVEESEYDHKCSGLLAQYAGNDILWVSCTGFTGDMSPLEGAIPSQDNTLYEASENPTT